MHELSNIGLMIHFRRDVEDRFRNLETVLKYYRNNSKNLEIIIINDDVSLDSGMKYLCKKYKCKGFLMENSGIYWRTKAFNEASKILEAEYIIAGDTDVIVSPEFLLDAKDGLYNDPTVGILYPYNGMFVHLKNKLAVDFFETGDLKPAEALRNTITRVPLFENENFLVAHNNSKGGMVMFKKTTYQKCNGYNPNFRGWGYEDDEILARFQKLGYKTNRVVDERAFAWHLPHDSTVREKHPLYNENRKHSDFVCECKDVTVLKNYMESWKI